MADSPDDLLPGPRILMGPGPTMADPRVLRAMATPLLGQFDPEFTAVMNEVMDLLRVVFQTRNERAFPVPGTGRAGLEAAMVSLLEPGDRVVVGECGRFGLLLIDIAERCGAAVVPVRAEWGRIGEPEAVARALGTGRTRMVAMIHGETSTGVLQPLAEIGRLARAHDALLMADAVVTLGGSEVATDDWGVDVMVAGTQKCLSCPSGLAPITYNARAAAVLGKRQSRIPSNYLHLLHRHRHPPPPPRAPRPPDPRAPHPPPRTPLHGLRAARGPPRRRRRGAGGALRASPPPRRRSAGRPRRHGPHALRPRDGRSAAALHHARGGARRSGRAGRAPAAHRGVLHRGPRRLRPAPGQDLAHRDHGLLRASTERAALRGRARIRAEGG